MQYNLFFLLAALSSTITAGGQPPPKIYTCPEKDDALLILPGCPPTADCRPSQATAAQKCKEAGHGKWTGVALRVGMVPIPNRASHTGRGNNKVVSLARFLPLH